MSKIDVVRTDDELEEFQGHQAAEILESEAFQRALKKVHSSTLDAWELATSQEDREVAHAKVCALRSIVEELGIVINNGRFVRKRREQQEAKAARGPGTR